MRDDGTRTHKEVRYEVMAAVKRVVGQLAHSSTTTAVEVDVVTTKDPEPGHVATIRVQDLEQGGPEKGERPWHVYRVMVVEDQK